MIQMVNSNVTKTVKISVNHCRVTCLKSRLLICWLSRKLLSATVIRSLDAAGFCTQ